MKKMLSDYENYTKEEWAEAYKKREDVLAYYFQAVTRYKWLPACDSLTEKAVRKEFSDKDVDLLFDLLVPPCNHVIHEWEDEDGNLNTAEDDRQQEVDEVTNDEMEEEAEETQQEKQLKLIGQTCYSCIIPILNHWIGILTKDIPQSDAFDFALVLHIMAMDENFIIASNTACDAREYVRAQALIELSILKTRMILKRLDALYKKYVRRSGFKTSLHETIALIFTLCAYLRGYQKAVSDIIQLQ